MDEQRADEQPGRHVTEGEARRPEDAATFTGATTPGLGRPPAFLLGTHAHDADGALVGTAQVELAP